MSQIQLGRSPSISSCFPERISGPGFGRNQPISETWPLHQLPKPTLPKNAVDKHLIGEQQVLPRTLPNSAPAVATLYSQQTVSIDLIDHVSSVSSPAAIELHKKPAPRPLPGPLQRLQSLPKTHPNSAPATVTVPSQQTTSFDVADHESSFSAPAGVQLHDKPAPRSLPGPLPAPQPHLPAFIKGQ